MLSLSTLTDDYYFEGVSVGGPEKKLETAARGVTIYNYESLPFIAPLPPYKASAYLNDVSMKLLKDHHDSFMQSVLKRALKQKHSLMAIPVATVYGYMDLN